MNGPDFREEGKPWWDNSPGINNKITTSTAVGSFLGTYTGIADDDHKRCDVPRAFYVSSERIVKARADGGMQDVREVLNEHKLPTRRREHRRVRTRPCQEGRKGIWITSYANSASKRIK